MDYQIKYLKKGFSLIELIVVIGIFAIFASLTTSVYYDTRSHTNLELSTGSIVEAVRLAQSSAQSGKGDSKWGIKILSNQIVIFKGDSYNTRDTTADNFLELSGGINVSGLSEIVFNKVVGTTDTVGVIVLSSNTESRNISVNTKGTVNY